MLRSTCWILGVVVWVSVTWPSGVSAYYVTPDYYLDGGQQTAFGGACDDVIDDVSAALHSHVNTLKLAKYAGGRHCSTTLDAGPTSGALMGLRVLHFDLEGADTASGQCLNDYIELYDGPDVNQTQLFGRYCGSAAPNLTGLATQRFLHVLFVTNTRLSFTGFSLLSVRSQPSPCQEDAYHCAAWDRCIDGRLRCDGTDHCLGRADDERGCTVIEQLVGGFLSLGLTGMLGVGILAMATCVLTCVIVCCYVCCRKRAPTRNVTALVTSTHVPNHHGNMNVESENSNLNYVTGSCKNGDFVKVMVIETSDLGNGAVVQETSSIETTCVQGTDHCNTGSLDSWTAIQEYARPTTEKHPLDSRATESRDNTEDTEYMSHL